MTMMKWANVSEADLKENSTLVIDNTNVELNEFENCFGSDKGKYSSNKFGSTSSKFGFTLSSFFLLFDTYFSSFRDYIITTIFKCQHIF